MAHTVKYPYIIVSETAANGFGSMDAVGVRHKDMDFRPNELSALDQAESLLDGRSRVGRVVYKAVYLVAPERPQITVTDIKIEEISP